MPGQTIGVSVFTEPLLVALQLTRDQLSLAYMAATIGSSLLLPWAGALYDRWGVRPVASLAALSLGLVLNLPEPDRPGGAVARPYFRHGGHADEYFFGILITAVFWARRAHAGVAQRDDAVVRAAPRLCHRVQQRVYLAGLLGFAGGARCADQPLRLVGGVERAGDYSRRILPTGCFALLSQQSGGERTAPRWQRCLCSEAR